MSNDSARHYHHGQSPAAWATVAIVGVGCLLGAVGAMIGPNMMVIYVAIAFVVVGPIVGAVMKGVGMGNG